MTHPRRWTLLLLIALTCRLESAGQGYVTPNRPFPRHTVYHAGAIRPRTVSQAQLDSTTAAFYDLWKSRYLRGDCGTDEFYVYDDERSPIICVSEGQGYGMIITAIMGGYDHDAQTYFDGLFRFFKNHPSSINPSLMAWKQITGCVSDPTDGLDAATDGDLDIAFALLLADNQWGSTGPINYRGEALTLLDAIMQDEINPVTFATKLGDWCTPGDPDFFHGTRTSDFMMDHFRVFRQFTGNPLWDSVTTECYRLIASMQQFYSPSTGLLPDFIIHVNTSPAPPTSRYLETVYDGAYSYNACRTPWRIATDYLLSGDERALNAVRRMNNWISTATGGSPAHIRAGYRLNGTGLPGTDYSAESFTGPFMVGALVDPAMQTWLDSLWSFNLTYDFASSKYYENTLKLLTMIVTSGNWWAPTNEPPEAPVQVFPPDGAVHLPPAITLRWHPVADATSYELQVASDSGFSSIRYADSLLADTIRMIVVPEPFATSYWRVRARGSGTPGMFSPAWTFRTALGQVSLAGAFGSATAPELRWHTVSGADSYRLQVSADPDFALTPLTDSVTTDTVHAHADVPSGQRWYWHVRAIVPDEEGDWSALSFFDAIDGASVTSFAVAARWNLISLPATTPDPSVSTLFPDATSPAYSFDQGYVQENTLTTRAGYWLKQLHGGIISVSGTVLTTDTIPVRGGVWNCIGSIGVAVPTATIASIPPGLTVSNFYYYRDGYFTATLLEPGRGYWIKPTADGSLIFSPESASPATNRIGIIDTGELPPSPPTAGIMSAGEIPADAELRPNYPNPFNPVTHIEVTSYRASPGTVKIFDLLGREVAVLFEGLLREGRNVFTWDPGAGRSSIPGGMYFCRLRTAESHSTIKLLYIK